MKKWALFLMGVMSLSCLKSISGMAAVCPSERPLVIGGVWKNENCPEFQIPYFSTLETTSFPQLEIPLLCDSKHCLKEEDKVLCQHLEETYKFWSTGIIPLEDHLIAVLRHSCKDDRDDCLKLRDLEKKLDSINFRLSRIKDEILSSNASIHEINQIITERNRRRSEYLNLCVIERNKYHHIKTHFPDPIPAKIGCPSDLLRSYVEILENRLDFRTRWVDRFEGDYVYTQRINMRLLLENMKREKDILEFEKFYTPEKEKQLSEEYEKALAEKCVSCDTPDPLDNIPKEDCNQCPNREYVDGKCVLKKE